MRNTTNKGRQAAMLVVALLALTARSTLAAPHPSGPQTNAPLPKADACRDHSGCKHPSTSEPATASPCERPRTLAAARERQDRLVARGRKQENGAKQPDSLAAEARATSFESYDAAFVDAVQQRWHDLLDRTHIMLRPGKVVLEFNLHQDGRITDLEVGVCEAGPLLGLLCQGALLDPAPYTPWPSDMRRMIGANHRTLTFTFYYDSDAFAWSWSDGPRHRSQLVQNLWLKSPTLAAPGSRPACAGQGYRAEGPSCVAWPIGSELPSSAELYPRVEERCFRAKDSLSLSHRFPVVPK